MYETLLDNSFDVFFVTFFSISISSCLLLFVESEKGIAVKGTPAGTKSNARWWPFRPQEIHCLWNRSRGVEKWSLCIFDASPLSGGIQDASFFLCILWQKNKICFKIQGKGCSGSLSPATAAFVWPSFERWGRKENQVSFLTLLFFN